MGFFDYLLPAVSAIQGAFANKPEKTTSTQTSTPAVADPATEDLRKQILAKQQALLTTDPDLTGYASSQAQEINRNSNLQSDLLRERAAASGTTGPALDAVLAGQDSQRFGAITNLNNNLPLQALTMKQQILNGAQASVNSAPRATTSVNTQTTSGNKLGGFISNLASTVAKLHGMGAFGNKAPAQPLPTGTGTPQIWP